MATLKERHIAYLEEQVITNSDLIRIIQDKQARFFSRHGHEPEVETTQADLANAKRKLAEATDLLARWRAEG